MSDVDELEPEEVLVALYHAFARSKDHLRGTGKWPQGMASRITPRVTLAELVQVSEERRALYARTVPELIRRGWARQVDDTDLRGPLGSVDLTQAGLEYARQLIEQDAA
jgi:hypothetical protein